MKTTSYEISKKLAKIGFGNKYPHEYLWEHNGIGATRFHKRSDIEDDYLSELLAKGYYPAYDLETILEALPTVISENKFGYGSLELMFRKKRISFAYEIFKDFGTHECGTMPHYDFEKLLTDESLADCAARLLLKLHSEKLIKF